MMRLLETADGESAVGPVVQFTFCWRHHVVVETLDLDSAFSRVVKIANYLHQLGNWITRCPTRFSRMRVSSACFERKQESHQTAQARRARRPIARHPNSVGNNDRVSAQVRRGPCNDLFEIRRTDLFFKLPKETDVDRDVCLERGARAVQGRKSRPF